MVLEPSSTLVLPRSKGIAGREQDDLGRSYQLKQSRPQTQPITLWTKFSTLRVTRLIAESQLNGATHHVRRGWSSFPAAPFAWARTGTIPKSAQFIASLLTASGSTARQ